MVKKIAVVAVALLATALGLLISPSPAHATNGDVTYTVNVGYIAFKTADGVLRAEMQNVKVVFWKNTIDGVYWEVVTGQLRDRSTDGYCAKSRYLGGTTYYGTECSGVWKDIDATLSDVHCTCGESVEVKVYRNTSGNNNFISGESAGYGIARTPSNW
ncbi:hypothetical protein [Dactylosporangium sp. NPDC048998]|uniref:hypothetical protein n=1 Tax=Dactylosporangium sp. NPDC048998 TaxID=3363976 RepID=UPI00371EC815